MRYCVYPLCNNTSETLTSESKLLSFFVFPSQLHLFEEWCEIVGRLEFLNKNMHLRNNMARPKLCSVHFDPKDIINIAKGKKLLRPFSIPKQCSISPVASTSYAPAKRRPKSSKKTSLLTGRANITENSRAKVHCIKKSGVPKLKTLSPKKSLIDGKYDAMMTSIIKAEAGDSLQILLDIAFGYIYRYFHETSSSSFDDDVQQETLASLQRWADAYSARRKLPVQKDHYTSASEEEEGTTLSKHTVFANTPTSLMATEIVDIKIHPFVNDTIDETSQNRLLPPPSQCIPVKQTDPIEGEATGLLLPSATAVESSFSRDTLEPKIEKNEDGHPTVVIIGNKLPEEVAGSIGCPTRPPIDAKIVSFEKSALEDKLTPNSYSWTQSESVVDVKIDVSDHVVHTQQMRVDLTCKSLIVREENKNGTDWITLLEGHLPFSINLEESSYSLSPGNSIKMLLVKKGEIFWDQLLHNEMAMDFEDSIIA